SMRSWGRRRSGVMWSSSPTSSPFKTPPASESRRASWGSSRRAATGNSPRWVDSLPEDSYAIHAHACDPADAARARSRGRARALRLERLRLQQVLTFTGTIREAGYEHPHGFVKLEGLRLCVRLDMRGDCREAARFYVTQAADQRRDVPQRPGDLGPQLIAAVAESSPGRGRSSLRSPSRIFRAASALQK